MTTPSRPTTEREALGQYQPGAPITPTGDPLTSGLGPGAWAERADHPDLTYHGEPKIVPMRVAQNFYVEPRDPDPRGMPVLGLDGVVAGTVVDLWVDRAEPQVRYLEIELAGGAGRTVLMPMTVCKVHGRKGVVMTKSIRGSQFVHVPGVRNPDLVTLLEEDKIMAFYAGGYLYATPERARPLV
jgi:photosynthetic reaction center H subunit